MRKGMTMISLVLYVILFFTFTVVASSVSINLNRKTLTEKADMIISSDYTKLYINLKNSAKNSKSVSDLGNKIVFDNNDVYEYRNNIIYKNNGMLIDNVKLFNTKNISALIGNTVNLTNFKENYLVLNVTLEKYGVTKNNDLLVVVGDNIE
jgi:hypothetical protein